MAGIIAAPSSWFPWSS